MVEFCNLGSLASAIDKGWLREERSMAAPLNMRWVAETAADLARGLAHLHAHGLGHHALTAESVLLQVRAGQSQAAACMGLRGLVRYGQE